MASPSQFLKLRDEEHSTRVQDNIGATLAPIANALNATPIMGAAPPAWISPNIIGGFANLGAGNALVAYHRDALGYVHAKGTVTHAAGCGAGTNLFIFEKGYRPSEIILVPAFGTGATAQFLSVNPDGSTPCQLLVAAGGNIGFYFSFLAER